MDWQEQQAKFGALIQPRQQQQAPTKQKGKGGFLSSIISELGGAGGATGGAAAGAALGSVVPGIGTLIGGILGGAVGGFGGGTVGRGIENKVRDDQNFFGAGGSAKAAFGEGALSGALGGLGGAASAFRGVKAAGGMKNLKAVTGGGDALAEASKAILKGGKKAGQAIATGGADDVSKLAGGLLRQSSVAGKSTLGSYSEQKALTDLTAQFPKLKGSAFNKFKNIEPVINTLHDDVTKKLANTGISINSNKVGERIARVADDIVDPLEKKKFFTLWNKTIQKEFGEAAPENLTLEQVNKLLGSVNKQASSAFRKITMGNPLTPADDAILLARDELGDFISENAPKAVRDTVTKLNRQQSVLIKGIPEFKRLSEQTVQILGTNIPGLSRGLTRGAQSASDVAGRTALKVGGLSDTLAGQVGKKTATRGLANNMFMPSAPQEAPQEQMPDMGAMTSDALYGATAMQQPNMQSDMSQQAPQSMYPLEQALADYQAAPDAKTQKQIMDYYDFVSKAEAAQNKATGAGGPNITKVTGQQYVLANRGANAVQQLAQLIQSDPGVVNRLATPGRKLPMVGGTISKVAGTGDYDAISYNVANALLRLETGAQANPEEIKNLQTQLMPRAGDSPETIQTKLQQLQEAFGMFLQTANDAGSLSSQISDYQPTYGGM